MRVPLATYRLQLNDAFTLNDARAVLPYLARLGISDLYLSPVFEARRGSTHGYDVTDPTRVRASIGGDRALRALAAEARALQLGILLDIVPNHMAATPQNPWWRAVLMHGPASDRARFFDIDWGTPDAPLRLRLPVLGAPLDTLIDAGEITIDPDACEVVYHQTRLPLAPGSQAGGADIRDVLARQHYELVSWRTASEFMSYRRFFDITDLAGVRVEDDVVFDATHSLIRSLAADGTITGLRIDHIDGLRDPAGYLRMLREKVRGPDGGPVYTVVEKILAPDERLPADWACEGTTGYEFLSLATGLLIEPHGHQAVEAFYQRVTADTRSIDGLVREKKLLVIQRLFGGELAALARQLAGITGLDTDAAATAIAELSASLGVYRTYTAAPPVGEPDRSRINAAADDARRHSPQWADAIAALRAVLLLEHEHPAALDFVMRWQQFTGPVMAKGFEDTALYCHHALLAVNDVGSDPVRPGLSTDELYARLAERQQTQARALNATATHDTKRGEDTRARLAVLSELPQEWRARLRRWAREGDEWKAELAADDDAVVPGADVDSLLYQTLLGAWPVAGADEQFIERVREYMVKAVREAKEQTSWRRPDEDFEQSLGAFIEKLMADFGREGLAEEVADFATSIAPHGALNALAQLLFKVTAPGVPDIYQGTELWSFTLVDPDNRRPVDFALRSARLEQAARLLEQPDAAALTGALDDWKDGTIKLYLTAAALRCRARHRGVFERGRVVPLPAEGTRADQVLAFGRVLDDDACIIVLPRWTTRLGRTGTTAALGVVWNGTVVPLPGPLRRGWRNVLTGQAVAAGATALDVAGLFDVLPFALLDAR